MNNILELFSTEVGSRMWRMEHEHSDFDRNVVYVTDSREFLLGERMQGKQVQNKEENTDYTYYEIGMLIRGLMSGNVNYLWTVMSPICLEQYRTSFTELRDVVSTNLSKDYYRSISGFASHNMYHFITGETKSKEIKEIQEKQKTGPLVLGEQFKLVEEHVKRQQKATREIDRESLLFKKKLNVIGRTLKFGINLLLWHKAMFEKVDIKDEKELYDLKNELDKAYVNCTLPEKPNPEPFEKYLIKWRLHKLKKDGLIE